LENIDNLLAKTINIKEIPSLPEAAKIAILNTLSIERSSSELSNIIKKDPLLTLKILRLANSPLYLRTSKVSNIKDAIVLLGYKTIKSIILSITIRDIFKFEETELFSVKAFWLHSIATAIVSEKIAEISNANFKDEAYTIGLLHDIGKVILLTSSEDEYKDVINAIHKKRIFFKDAEISIFGFDHTDVATFLFKYWELPIKIIKPINDHHISYTKSINGNYIKNILILKLANEIAHISGYGIDKLAPPYQVDREIIEHLGLLQEDLDEVLEQLKKSIFPITEALTIPNKDIKGFFEVLESANRELGKMYLINQKITKNIKIKENMLQKLNDLCLTFLKEKEIGAVIMECSKSLLKFFDLNSVLIEFYLNEKKSILCSAFYPKLFTEKDKLIKSKEIEESEKIIDRESIIHTEKKGLYLIKTLENNELGKIFIEPEKEISEHNLKPFMDYISLGLSNLKFYLTNTIKTEKLNIAVKQLKEENEKRKELVNFNTLILNSSPIGIVSIDKDGNIIHCNKESEILLKQDLEKENFFKLNLIIQNHLQDTIRDIINNKTSTDISITSNGKTHYYNIKTTGIDETKNTLISIHDITERKENERIIIQKEKMATLGELAQGIAHNLRSPLAVVKGIPELLISEIENKNLKITKMINNEEKEDEDVKDNLKLISKSMEKALTIINSIMEFSKEEIENFEELDIENIINEANILLNNRLNDKDIKLTNNTHNCKISGNKNMILQVFMNLINNSINAIKNKGKIEVSYKKMDDKIIIYFMDNGTGIKKENLDRIFEPFFTTSGKANGTGIGLSITRKMVIGHGGTIRALPKKGGGTTMEITFPIKVKGKNK